MVSKLNKKLIGVALIVLIAFTGVVATYIWFNQQKKLGVVRVATLLGGISTLDVMEKKNIAEKYGLNLTVLRLQKTPDILAALSKGEVDAAIIPAEMAAKLIQDGIDIVIFAIDMFQNQAILTKAFENTDVGDLKGKVIGALLASGTYKMFKAYMSTVYGLEVKELVSGESPDPNKINVINVVPSQIIDALVTGGVDAIVIWEPFVSKAVVNYEAKILKTFVDMWKDSGRSGKPVMLVWVARKELANSDILVKLAKAREEAAREWVNEKTNTVSILVNLYNLDLDVANYLYNRVEICLINLNTTLIESIRQIWWLAWKGGYLTEDPSNIPDSVFWSY